MAELAEIFLWCVDHGGLVEEDEVSGSEDSSDPHTMG